MDPFPFHKSFHTIFCRNVMIYFDRETKDELVRKFYDFLVPGGYLIIGQSESIDRDNSDFKYIMPSVYRKE
jgi:chemotaxis protein methyltransferase CheR